VFIKDNEGKRVSEEDMKKYRSEMGETLKVS
jgi:hypothetical protein